MVTIVIMPVMDSGDSEMVTLLPIDCIDETLFVNVCLLKFCTYIS